MSFKTRYHANPYERERRKTPSEIAHEEAWQMGHDYMEGKKSINEVERFLNTGTHGGLSRKELHKAINAGATQAETYGKAKASRVQPLQEELTIGPKKKGKRIQGKLATRPEHTRYKAPAKEAPKVKVHEAKRAGALNTYDVKSQRKKDLKILLDKHAKGQIGVKEVKHEAKEIAGKSARKNVVYNETHHRFVGKNRVTR